MSDTQAIFSATDKSATRYRFAMVEMNSQSDIYVNLIAIEHATAHAMAHGADLVIVPENAFSFGNHLFASVHFDALKNWCGQLARQYNVHFLAGTLPCPCRPDGTPVPNGKFRQTALLFDPAGDCVARYDKIHLFKATVNGNKSAPSDKPTYYDEGKTFEAGDTPVVAKTTLGNIGMMVCYDLRFAEMAKYLRAKGAEILTAPSAFVYETGERHWATLLRARALDAQCILLGLGQTGTHYLPLGQRRTWGHSEFINANGQALASQIVQANPFDITLQKNQPLAKALAKIVTPLAHQAHSWLNTPIAAEENLHLPKTVTLYLADFDPSEQAQFRQNIDLAASQRFHITSPTNN